MTKERTTAPERPESHDTPQDAPLDAPQAGPAQGDGEIAGPEGASGREADSGKKKEVGGPKGPEPTRYGDWERGGRCVDF